MDLDVVTSGEFTGTLKCPLSTVVCTGNPCDTNTCSGHGTCQEAQDGVCQCDTTFYGDTAYLCDKKRCPTGTNDGGSTVECSGHGSCQSDATQANSGVCTCQVGYRGAACDELGCPQGPEKRVCTPAGSTNCVSQRVDCYGRGSCNVTTGECNCNPTFLAPDCVLTECPRDTNSITCANHGTCDEANGYCDCSQTTAINVTTGEEFVTSYYTGKDCSQRVYGDRYPVLYFTGEDRPSHFAVANIDPSSGKAVPALVRMEPEQYTYFSFNVESAAYVVRETGGVRTAHHVCVARHRYQYEVTLTWDGADVNPHIVACYADSCSQPSLGNAQFFASVIDLNQRTKTIVFVPDDSSPTSSASFDRVGAMRIGIISQVAANGTISVTRDPCAILQCVHGTCFHQACQCDTTTLAGVYVSGDSLAVPPVTHAVHTFCLRNTGFRGGLARCVTRRIARRRRRAVGSGASVWWRTPRFRRASSSPPATALRDSAALRVPRWTRRVLKSSRCP